MPFLETRDRPRLFYRDWRDRRDRSDRRDDGSGSPIVFLAGWALSSAMWQDQMLSLSRRHRCIAVDRRGHGRSDDPGDGYDYDTLADDLAALLSRLELRDVTLVAHSMAGGEVVRYLSRHGGERVARVLLLAATLPFPLRTDDNPDGIDGGLFEAARAQWRADFPRWLRDNAAPYVGDLPAPHAVSDEVRDWTRRDMEQTSLQAVLACNHAVVETDFRDELRAMRVPTLIIQGSRDQSIPLELSGQRTAQLIPGCRLEVYPDAPHGLYLSHRDRLGRDLEAFVEGGEPR